MSSGKRRPFCLGLNVFKEDIGRDHVEGVMPLKKIDGIIQDLGSVTLYRK